MAGHGGVTLKGEGAPQSLLAFAKRQGPGPGWATASHTSRSRCGKYGDLPLCRRVVTMRSSLVSLWLHLTTVIQGPQQSAIPWQHPLVDATNCHLKNKQIQIVCLTFHAKMLNRDFGETLWAKLVLWSMKAIRNTSDVPFLFRTGSRCTSKMEYRIWKRFLHKMINRMLDMSEPIHHICCFWCQSTCSLYSSVRLWQEWQIKPYWLPFARFKLWIDEFPSDLSER